MVSMWPCRNSQLSSRSWFSIVLLCVLSLLVYPIDASIFSVLVPQLEYDIVNIQSAGANIDDLPIVLAGTELSASAIEMTANIPKNGISAILYDMGYGCQSGVNPSNTTATPNLFGLPKIALIERGSPPDVAICSFRDKMLVALSDGAVAVIIYNGAGLGPIEGATASSGPADAAINIPGLVVGYDSGSTLKTMLSETNSTNITIPDTSNLVRVFVSSQQKMPVIWEFVLIVVVVLLGVSFSVSVVLHCRLYALRQRYRAEAIARGGDVLPNGTIRLRKTLEKTALDEFPVRVFGQSGTMTPVPSESGTEAGSSSFASTSMSTSTLADQTEEKEKEKVNKDSDSNGWTTVDLSAYPSDGQDGNDGVSNRSKILSRTNSASGESIRSATAIAAAEALDAQAVPTASPLPHELVNDTCAICIEDFVDGDQIRKLPCYHEFHCECIDPWLTRKSSTCPLCKYECIRPTPEQAREGGEASTPEQPRIAVPNDRLMEFIMGPEWVASRMQTQHNGTSWVDRMGHFFGRTWDRIRGRPPRPPLGPTVPLSPVSSTPLPMIPEMTETGEMPMHMITVNGVTAMSEVGVEVDGETQASQDAPSVVVPMPPLDDTPLPPLPSPVIDDSEERRA
ncbi:hypothetical protein BGZ99_006119 [Dissophora globulifera]|uniref:RING-type E3 ubiquitin transferase n=1 Tax=Dissophora globulifera TaxID=979702 RepID=A0A9P6RED0_9FUNG|nr:hypothetical protein BGZ99_006119 [Dissophora globulifera]